MEEGEPGGNREAEAADARPGALRHRLPPLGARAPAGGKERETRGEGKGKRRRGETAARKNVRSSVAWAEEEGKEEEEEEDNRVV